VSGVVGEGQPLAHRGDRIDAPRASGPEHQAVEKPWIKNPPGATNEVQVDYRRSWPPQKVLDEFREVYAERLKSFEGADLDAESWTPIGPGKVRDLLAIRVMDCWVHEQDIRRAVGKAGHLDGPLAEHAFARHSTALPFVVGKKVAPPEKTTVVFDVEGLGAAAVEMRSPRAAAVEAPDEPTVRLAMDLETFNRLCCGRGENAEVGTPYASTATKSSAGRSSLDEFHDLT